METLPSPDFLRFQEALKGRYSLERELGRGGMGIVYLAHEVALDRPVAIKLLPPVLAAAPALRQRFLREARTAARLSHPNIVPIYAVDELDGFVFFVMAYIDGTTLGDLVRERGPLPKAEAVRILREIAWALAYAHAHGVIHRDVKPENVLIEHATGRVFVMDFGIAHVAAQPGFTTAGEVLGTAEFMSPEQASGEKLDARSDIYSFGVLAYYALAGRLPHEAATVQAVLAKHLTQPAPPLASLAPQVPQRLARTVHRCLAKDPAERFADAEQLAEALGESAAAVPDIPVPLRVFVKNLREQGRHSGAFVFLMLLLSAGLIPAAVEGGLPGLVALAGGILAAASLPLLASAHYARAPVRLGYTLDDLRAAIRMDIERRQEELAFEFGPRRSLVERVASTLSLAGAFGFVAAASGLALGVPWIPSSVLSSLLGLSGVIAVLSGLVAAHRYEARTDIEGRRIARVWRGRIGEWLYRLARLGRKARAIEPATHRRTEIALGMAADRLFEQLPKSARRQLRDLPATVRRLEADALRMRGRIEQLARLLAEVEEGPSADRRQAGSSTAERRLALSADIKEAQEAAQQRLADAVAALETIRLNLLRMVAGSGSVGGLTADLLAAREVSDAIARLLESRREIETLLAEGHPAAR